MFSWLLLTSYNAQLLVFMTQTIFHRPFYNLETLFYHTDYIIVTEKNTDVQSDFKVFQHLAFFLRSEYIINPEIPGLFVILMNYYTKTCHNFFHLASFNPLTPPLVVRLIELNVQLMDVLED